jgi:hypothetical protein
LGYDADRKKKGQGRNANAAPADAKASDAKALRSAGEVQARYKQNPPQPAYGKQIHSRRPLPMVPEGPEKK